ncbi:mothers against decapentaplegic homolog 6 [Stomoxys calcitrans]|uniref:Mothers against decapentaplegic homolog n=1 Tax=Stomoxys calcitrans TaxID=35570 RepID=A0A1I8Q7Q5_STOCA|nr:mothers against decapentaplegic homolog 6 [Stomoxys calcitrans]XP_059220147.1 mothers against decapentaplegic homolog 6 [Stomoxys calcitrans]XP_059220148.1 mothers against decapentaplegic homolog 6 [Stomoxys calcitrans]
MKFQSEKKELWRYASKKPESPKTPVLGTNRSVRGSNRTVRGTNRQCHPLQHLPQHETHRRQLLLRQEEEEQQNYPQMLYCDVSCESSNSLSMRPQVSTPPPPYSSVAALDCSMVPQSYQQPMLMFRQHQGYATTDVETETSLSTTETSLSETASYGRRQTRSSNNAGYNYANTGDMMLVDDCEKLNESSSGSSSSTYHLPRKIEQTMATSQRRSISRTTGTTITACSAPAANNTSVTSVTGCLAATAVKFLMNCCGVSFGSTNSVAAPSNTTSPSHQANNNNNTTCNKQNYESSKKIPANNYPDKDYFNAFTKKLNSHQISLLLKAVKSRREPAAKLAPLSGAGSSERSSMTMTHQTNCILVPREQILGEEPNVIVCRLFLWEDLNNSSQLKRLPVCPNERDPVYVCCNPLHWCRILETESAPPPYQSQRMNRNEGLPFQNYGNSTSFGSSEADGISSIRKTNSNIYVRMAESLTTDGLESRCSRNWCEVAYWELSQRVGELYPAETPTINIFSDKPNSSDKGQIEGMCLKDLIEKRTSPSPNDVQTTRQKIGLGVTLSQESDGVWLYNRSTAPIFVYSPTLMDSMSRVCRVEPGDCLRAFDIYKAHSLDYSDHGPGIQTGPIDNFSMRISFAKGWGCTYKRPDVTLCPCWLEVLFRQQR